MGPHGARKLEPSRSLVDGNRRRGIREDRELVPCPYEALSIVSRYFLQWREILSGSGCYVRLAPAYVTQFLRSH